MIPLPPHRTKGPGVLGAERPGDVGPFGRRPDPDETEEEKDETRS